MHQLHATRRASCQFAAALALAAFAGLAQGQTTDRANVDNTGFQGTQTTSSASGGHVSTGGVYVVFTSGQVLTPGAPASGGKVYVRDRARNITTLISAPDPSMGAVTPNGGSFVSTGAARVISDNGRFVIFTSAADNLVPNDTNGVTDIFVRDRDLDNDGIFDEAGAGNVRTSRVNLTSSESAAFGGCPNFTCTHYSDAGAISASGRYVIWESQFSFDSQLDGGGFNNVYWRDRDADNDGVYDESGGAPDAAVTRLASKRVNCGGCGPNGFSTSGSISADGKWVVFDSADSNLVFSDNNNAQDVFFRNMFDVNSFCVRASLSAGGAEGSGQGSFNPDISGNGRFIAFATNRSEIVVDDGPSTDIVVRDRDADNDGIFDEAGALEQTVELISLGRSALPLPGGSTPALNGASDSPAISDDGRYVAFHSDATNFSNGLFGGEDTNGQRDVFVRDRLNNTTSRVSVSALGAEANDQSSVPNIDGSGRFVGFISEATNLIEFTNDSNGSAIDTYVRALRPLNDNDTCGGVIVLTTGLSIPTDTFGANDSGGTSCDGNDLSPDMIFSYTASCTGEVSFNTFGSAYDTILSVHSACPPTDANAIVCNDDASGFGLLSSVNLFTQQGATYYVRLGGFQVDAGFARISVSGCSPCCPGNADKVSPGTVNFDDITTVLANFGGPAGAGDADCNGTVNFDDLTSVLSNFGNACN